MRNHGALICSFVALCLLAAVPSLAGQCGISGDEGSYKRSCQNCSKTGTILSCDCQNRQRFFVHTSIDLSDCRSPNSPDGDPLSNNDGRLSCGHCSTPGACCLSDASCAVKTFNDCESVGIFKGDNRACADVSCDQQTETEIHWTNPNGGDFGVDGNWNPQQVPTFDDQRSDTAIFDLAGIPLIAIQATNNAVGRWIIRHMGIDLIGPAQVKSTFVVDDGGKLLVDSAATFSTNDGVVGDETGSESGVLVAATQSLWKVVGPLAIGRRAPGKVIVDENGALDAQQSITIGNVLELGTGSTFDVGGVLEVEGGGRVTTPNLTLNEGSIRVRGRGQADSLVEIASALDIGGQIGTGSVAIEGGGDVRAQRVLVGDRAGTGGETVTISGVGSTLEANGELQVAGDAATQIEVKDGGTLSTLGMARVGKSLAVGKVVVHGKSGTTNARWDASDDVLIGGQLVASELVVEDGGRVKGSKSMVLGRNAGDLASVTVSGIGSVLNVDTLRVGADGRGELTIDDGLVKSRLGKVGQSVTLPGPGGGTGSGVVTIDGSGARWHVTGDCAVGVDEPGVITLVSQPFLFGAVLRVDGRLDVFPQGRITGSGTLTAPHTFNQGFISPGLSPGHIVIEGDYEQAPDGALKIEAAGLGPGQFDVLDITGNATLAGKIELRFIDGYVPKAGDGFDFLDVGGTTGGSFDEVDVAGVAHGFAQEMTMTGGVVRVTAKNDAQPESCADPDDADGDGALGCNFLVNPGMEEEGGSAALPRAWVPSDSAADRRKCNRGARVFSHTGSCAYQLVGRGDAAAHELEQTMVGIVGEAGRSLTLAAWARGRNIPAGTKPKLQLELLSSGVVVKRSRVPLASGSYGYTRFARAFTVPSGYDEARIHIRYDGASGKLLVDDVTLGVE